MENKNKFDFVPIGSLILAILTALGGILRVVLGKTTEERLSATTLTYFAVAGALLLLRQIKTISIGETKVELRGLEEKANQAMELAKTAVDASGSNPSPKTDVDLESVHSETVLDGLKAAAKSVQRGPHKDDPWKGQFGGIAERNGRRLAAQVKALIDDDDYFLVRLTVESLSANMPLEGSVQFFLHDSFRRNPIVPVVGGKAEFRVRSYGAFTVGVLADEGKTMLELDLAEDRSFPRKFRVS